MVTQRERLWQIVGQGLEAPKVGEPLRVAQFVKADALRCAVVAPTQFGFREVGGCDLIAEPVGQLYNRR